MPVSFKDLVNYCKLSRVMRITDKEMERYRKSEADDNEE
jgi:hypothetical protein